MRISIVVPAYNVEPWIGRTLGSAVAQTHADWTLTVVDDGSTDGTVDVVACFPDPRIRLLRQVNAGVAVARNRGLASIGGDAVLFLDADDWLAPDALARLAASLAADPDAVAAVAGFAFVPEHALPGSGLKFRPDCPDPGNAASPIARIRVFAGTPIARIRANGDMVVALLERNRFANGGHLLVRREAIERVGGFRVGLAYGEDWECWIRLALLGRFVRVPGRAPALFVRQRSSGTYVRLARHPESFGPCMDAIFGNPALLARVGPARLAELRARAEAENAWIVGRELVRHGRTTEGRAWLRRSVAAKPTARRGLLLAAAYTLPLLPPAARGPFRTYSESARRSPFASGSATAHSPAITQNEVAPKRW